MAFRKTFLSAAAAAMFAVTSAGAADDGGVKPRLGVSIIETSNNAGVIVTKIDDDSSAEKLDRVGDGKDLKLEPRKHAITHVNGHQVPTVDNFLKAIAASPKDCTLRVYEYATADWSDHRVKLRGEPTVVETQTVEAAPQYWMDANGNVYSQDGQYQYTQQGYSQQQQQQYAQTDNRGERKSKKSFFNMFGQPEGEDWRPGDNTWWFQKKPENKELRKAYNRQVFAELLTGVAAGLDGAAAGMDSYQPYTPSGSSSGVNINMNRIQMDSFNRNYSTNPDHAPFINWAY